MIVINILTHCHHQVLPSIQFHSVIKSPNVNHHTESDNFFNYALNDYVWYKYNVHALAIIVMGFSTQFPWSSHAILALMNALLHTISHDLLFPLSYRFTASADCSLHPLKTTFTSEQLTISKRLFMMIRKVVEAQWYCCQSDALYNDR